MAKNRKPSFIVGMGASAGGLAALEAFFDNMQPGRGLAFVIVQHLSPNYDSVMDQIIGRHTSMPVKTVIQDVEIEADTVYIIPPGREFRVNGTTLHLSKLDRGSSPPSHIDVFLSSLASEMGPRAIAVILSGTGTDGSAALAKVKDAGGAVFVQDPTDADFPGMPNSAIDSGQIDYVSPASALPQGIFNYLDTPSELIATEKGDINNIDGSESEVLSQILTLLRGASGLDFAQYKQSTIIRRIDRRMKLLDHESAEHYLEHLLEDVAERDHLFHDLLIGVTRFFRDPEAFAALRGLALPPLFKQRSVNDSPIRAWVPGCATGEEAYTIAILLKEAANEADLDIPIKVFATDIHRSFLKVAGRGVYSATQLEFVPDRLVAKYFQREGDDFVVTQELRSMVVFAAQDLLNDPPFTHMDLISCRNLLIYFQNDAQKRALALFHNALNKSGILLLGPSETLGGYHQNFDLIDSVWRLFRKRDDAVVDNPPLRPALRRNMNVEPRVPFTTPRRSSVAQLIEGYDALLSLVVEDGVFLDPDGVIIHVFGDSGRFLRRPEGRPDHSLVGSVSGDLKTAITAALHRCRRDGTGVNYVNVATSIDGQSVSVNVDVQPAVGPNNESTYFFVRIADADVKVSGEAEKPGDETEPNVGPTYQHVDSERLVQDLEYDLQVTRETLQTTIEEVETSNEELQATNEELMSANEELQSTNEELNSVNQELYTLNADNQRKIAELSQMSTDVDFLISASQIATIFLAEDFTIRKYTEGAAVFFNILPADVGRPIGHITPKFEYTSFLKELREAASQNLSHDREIRTEDGNWGLLRFRPYLLGGRSSGVVVTIVDINQLKAKDAELQLIKERFEIIANSSRDVIWITDPGLKSAHYISPSSESILGLRESALSDGLHSLKEIVLLDDAEVLDEFLEGSLEGDRDVTICVRHPISDELRWLFHRSSALRDGDGNIQHQVCVTSDITESREATLALEQTTARLQLMVSLLPFPAAYVTDDNVRVNDALEKLTGFGAKQLGNTERFFNCLLGEQEDDHLLLYETDKKLGFRQPRRLKIKASNGIEKIIEMSAYFADQGEIWIFNDVTVVEGAHRALVRARDKAEENARLQTEFVANISHEIRTPLNGVLGMTDLLIETSLNKEQKEFVSVIKNSGESLLGVIDSVLNMSRLESGAIQLNPERVHLKSFMMNRLQLHERRAAEKGLSLNARFATANVDEVLLDRGLLAQVLDNLVGNAVKFTQSGGVDTSVTFYIRSGQPHLRIAVDDTGVGIDPENLPDIFQRFRQADSSTNRRFGGTGLGLAIVARIAKLMSADVRAEAIGTGGTRFIFDVPLQDDEYLSDTKVASEKSCEVLVAEDDPASAKLLGKILEGEGHKISYEVDGQKAVDAAMSRKFDLILMDWMMPHVDGLAATQKIRSADGPNKESIIIAITAKSMEGDEELCLSAGMNGYLARPVNAGRLNSLIFQYLNLGNWGAN